MTHCHIPNRNPLAHLLISTDIHPAKQAMMFLGGVFHQHFLSPDFVARSTNCGTKPARMRIWKIAHVRLILMPPPHYIGNFWLKKILESRKGQNSFTYQRPFPLLNRSHGLSGPTNVSMCVSEQREFMYFSLEKKHILFIQKKATKTQLTQLLWFFSIAS